MFCPNPACQTPPQRLHIALRQSVEIDYCPQCRGVWLDRGELDKLLAHERQDAPVSGPRDADFNERRPAPASTDRELERHAHSEHARYPRPRRKSLLGELFDFD